MMMSKPDSLNTWHSIQTFRRILAAEYHPHKNYARGIVAAEALSEICDSVRGLRKKMRPMASPKTFVERIKSRTEVNTREAVANLMRSRPRTKYNIDVGGSGRAYKISAKMTGFRLGWLWFDRVYTPLINNGHLDTKNIFPVKAVEYRVNVRDVRLFAVTAWDFTKKKEVQGYVGLSTFSGRCLFRPNIVEAINAAKKLTVQSVDEKLGVNQNG